ncbi:CinA family protein [bacterium]|nr:CinA family protein [bacterium]
MFLKKIFVNISFILLHIVAIVFLKREKKIATYLLMNALKLSTAESCTGGLISSRLTDLSGSSAYIFQNFVTYANAAKVKLLGVSPDTIEKYGVVSDEVAQEMVKGLLDKYDCSIAIATTGIAGPLGSTDTKPVGLVYIGIGDKNITKSYRYEANPLLYRRIMKYAFSDKAFDLLIEFLEENY